MSSHDISPADELVQLTRLASEARGLCALVSIQYQLRAALRRVLVLRQWPHLEEAHRELKDSPSLAARFYESLHCVLETPELGAREPGAAREAREPGARWHGLVLAIPVALTSRAGTLVSLPHPLALALRESLQERLPRGTGIRLANRPLPQFVAHTMGTRSLYELIAELASGEHGAAAAPGSQPASAFVPHGRSLGQHYLFALAVTTRPEQFALEIPGGLQTEPGLVKWAGTQTEKITSDFAERGWPLLMRVSAPRRLREMLSSPPVLSDVRELDGLLDHVASKHGVPVTMLKADLALSDGEEAGLRIAISDRRVGTPLAHGLYRLAALGAEAGAYRVAVRLASAGVELVAADENLRRAVQRAIALTDSPAPSETATPGESPTSGPSGTKAFRSRFSRSLRYPT
jgi:hypothetical protein